jgi:hypothetical protein
MGRCRRLAFDPVKRTCYGCRALSGSPQSTGGYRCDLAYRTDPHGHGGPRPLVECPKPRTVAGFYHWQAIKSASNGQPPLFEPGIDGSEGMRRT